MNEMVVKTVFSLIGAHLDHMVCVQGDDPPSKIPIIALKKKIAQGPYGATNGIKNVNRQDSSISTPSTVAPPNRPANHPPGNSDII